MKWFKNLNKEYRALIVIVSWVAIIIMSAITTQYSEDNSVYDVLMFIICLLLIIAITSSIWQYKILKEESSISTNNWLTKQNFKTSKKVNNILIDDGNKKWLIQNKLPPYKIHKFSDITSFDLQANGKSVVSGNAGKALFWGVALGPVGAIAAGSSKQTITQSGYTDIKIYIRLNSLDNLQEVIMCKDMGTAQQICSALEYMMNYGKNVEPVEEKPKETKAIQETNNDLDELKKYKQMLDDGLISQEDYDKKKNQILGL